MAVRTEQQQHQRTPEDEEGGESRDFVDTIPEGAGLSSGASGADVEPEVQSVQKSIERSAAGDALAPQDAAVLLEHFLDTGSINNEDEPVPIAVKVGHGKAAKEYLWKVRAISWDEWDDSRTRATDDATGEYQAFTAASYMVARALVEPQLGEVVKRLRASKPEGAPADAAALLRRMFARESGALLELNGKVLEISKLMMDNNAVREVEAGKT